MCSSLGVLLIIMGFETANCEKVLMSPNILGKICEFLNVYITLLHSLSTEPSNLLGFTLLAFRVDIFEAWSDWNTIV